MTIPVENVRAQLQEVSEALSWTLDEVLEKYKPDQYLAEQLKKFLPEWGKKPFHEFLEYNKMLDPNETAVDVLNSTMEPVNIFWILDEFY